MVIRLIRLTRARFYVLGFGVRVIRVITVIMVIRLIRVKAKVRVRID